MNLPAGEYFSKFKLFYKKLTLFCNSMNKPDLEKFINSFELLDNYKHVAAARQAPFLQFKLFSRSPKMILHYIKSIWIEKGLKYLEPLGHTYFSQLISFNYW